MTADSEAGVMAAAAAGFLRRQPAGSRVPLPDWDAGTAPPETAGMQRGMWRWPGASGSIHEDVNTGAVFGADGLMDGTGSPAESITAEAGDIVLVPKRVAHLAGTPPDPGFSQHLVFAVGRDPAD